MSKLMLTLATFALAVASAATTYHVTVNDPIWVGGNEVKAGDYKVAVEGNKVTFTSGKKVVEAPAKVETNSQKFSSTALISEQAGGKQKLSEIRIGGTTTKIVLEPAPANAGGTN